MRAFGRLIQDPRGFTRLDAGEESDDDLKKGAGSEREAKVTPVGEDGEDAVYGMKARGGAQGARCGTHGGRGKDLGASGDDGGR